MGSQDNIEKQIEVLCMTASESWRQRPLKGQSQFQIADPLLTGDSHTLAQGKKNPMARPLTKTHGAPTSLDGDLVLGKKETKMHQVEDINRRKELMVKCELAVRRKEKELKAQLDKRVHTWYGHIHTFWCAMFAGNLDEGELLSFYEYIQSYTIPGNTEPDESEGALIQIGGGLPHTSQGWPDADGSDSEGDDSDLGQREGGDTSQDASSDSDSHDSDSDFDSHDSDSDFDSHDSDSDDSDSDSDSHDSDSDFDSHDSDSHDSDGQEKRGERPESQDYVKVGELQ